MPDALEENAERGMFFRGGRGTRGSRKGRMSNPEKWGKGIQIAMIRLNSAIIRGKGVS